VRADVHIVHFSDTWLPRRDGVVTSIQTLVRGLHAEGHHGTTVVPRHPDADELLDVPTHPMRSVPCGVANLRLAVTVRSRHVEGIAGLLPDLIHVHTPGPLGLLGVLSARRLGVPLVQTYHTDLHAYVEAYRIPVGVMWALKEVSRRRLGAPGDPGPARMSPGGGRAARRSAARRAYMDLINRTQLGGADALVVPTRTVLDRIALPVPADRVHVIPTGVGVPVTTTAAVAAFRDRHGLGGTRPTVLFVGRVNQEKGIDLLLPAFARVRAALPDARLVVVGAVYDRGWFDRLVNAAGLTLGQDLVVCGQLSPAEVAAGYAAADVFAFPSLTDTQGLVLQEAALAELPVVMCDAGLHAYGPLRGAARLTRPEPEALADGIIRAIISPPASAELHQSARALAGRQSPERYAAAVAEVYRQVRARRSQRRGLRVA
jgi:glycosyltransferase involved in cell wall biosynthesis